MSRLNLETCTLTEMAQECQEAEGTTYGHNIIGIICRVAEKRFSKKAAEQLFEQYQG
jgi:hypothetical protein